LWLVSPLSVQFCGGSGSRFLSFGTGTSGRSSPCWRLGQPERGCSCGSSGRRRWVAGCDGARSTYRQGHRVPVPKGCGWVRLECAVLRCSVSRFLAFGAGASGRGSPCSRLGALNGLLMWFWWPPAVGRGLRGVALGLSATGDRVCRCQKGRGGRGEGFPQKLTPVSATRRPDRLRSELASVLDGSCSRSVPIWSHWRDRVNIRRVMAVI
jgi:hypothetical protein